MGWGFQWRPYVPVAKRRADAMRQMEKLKRKGRPVSPVVLAGRQIATTFWGKAWCENLEAYSDYSNRLPRGRTYVRNGSVVDLQIASGQITARVSGSSLYTVKIGIKPHPPAAWKAFKDACSGQITSALALLQGKLPKPVLEVITCRTRGLFPSPKEITLECSCPDWADMCKHVAAVLYGVGTRLDHQPELFFLLRGVDHLELLSQARTAALAAADTRQGLAESEISDIFGIELDGGTPAATPKAKPPVPKAVPMRKPAKKGAEPASEKTSKSKPRRAGKAKAAQGATKAKCQFKRSRS